MKVTKEKFEISPHESISWADVKTMRVSGGKLALVLNSGRTVELGKLHPSLIDWAFRAFDGYLSSQGSEESREES